MKKVFIIILLFLFIASAIAYFFSFRFLEGMPQMMQLLLKTKHGSYVSIDEMNLYIPEAAIASQDRRYYSNSGIDVISTIRAIYFTLVTGERQGASTITEQLVKNVYFSDVDNLKTDILTKILAVVITTMYPKKTILEVYLNSIYYGKQNYGIGNASQYYFTTLPKDVTLAQSAYLLGLINAPSYLSAHKNEAIKTADLVIQEMLHNKYISQTQASQATNELNNFR